MNYVRTYKLTAFEPTGELITEETFTAETDDAAKVKGQAMLEEKNLLEQNTPPCLSSWEIIIVPFLNRIRTSGDYFASLIILILKRKVRAFPSYE